MKKLKWSDRFKVKIDEIDHQHRELLEIVNDLIEDFSTGHTDEQFENHLKLLRRYAHLHFETEEQYLKENAPQLLKEQVIDHRQFEVTLKDFYRQYLNNRPEAPIETLKFLIKWIKDHLLTIDKKYEREITSHETIVTLIDWAPSMSVNVKKMDQQHQALIQQLNLLYHAITSNKTHEQMEEIMAKLLKYTREHFTKEEEYMKAAGYPGLENQQRAHSEFISMVEECHQSLEFNKNKVATDLVKFLLNWFNMHIMVADKKYTETLNNKGIK